jgi:ATPase subunit of ABC transporter with duplicated ATPase domains
MDDNSTYGTPGPGYQQSSPYSTAGNLGIAPVVAYAETPREKGVTPASTPSSDASLSDLKAAPAGEKQYAPLVTTKTRESVSGLPPVRRTESGRELTSDEVMRILSRRRTNASGAAGAEHEEERAEIQRLMSRMFGAGRQANSLEEKTRHVGLSFKHLTVKGMGLGAALQPTVGDILLGLPRLIKGLLTRGPKSAASSKPPIRTILNDFSGCVRPGEMLLVLGRPGSGCSTFLKVLGNQRFGFVEVSGDVTYGGASAAEMMKKFRGEVVYNPEDDLHYPTLTVKETLTFALKTRTPGKESRQEGETRGAYVREFLRVVSKLFWIEHTMKTKVGDAFIRGVSGGEKKR